MRHYYTGSRSYDRTMTAEYQRKRYADPQPADLPDVRRHSHRQTTMILTIALITSFLFWFALYELGSWILLAAVVAVGVSAISAAGWWMHTWQWNRR